MQLFFCGSSHPSIFCQLWVSIPSLSLLYPLLCLLLPLYFICPTSSLELFRHFVANIYRPHHCYFFTPDISLLLAQPTLLMKKLKCRQEKTVQEKPVNRPNVKTMRDGIRGRLPADSRERTEQSDYKTRKKGVASSS